MQVIQFESVVEGNMIRIPEEYADAIYSGVKVMVFSQPISEDAVKPTARAGSLAFYEAFEPSIVCACTEV